LTLVTTQFTDNKQNKNSKNLAQITSTKTKFITLAMPSETN